MIASHNNTTTARMMDAEEDPTERQWSVVEAAANETLDVIQQVVDMLKHHFSVTTAVTGITGKNHNRASKRDDDKEPLTPPRGRREELPMDAVEKLQWQARHCWDSTRAALRLLVLPAGGDNDAVTEVTTLLAWEENTTSREDNTPSSAEDVLGSTLLLLMMSLWQNYEVLDRLPSNAPPMSLSKNDEPAGQHNNNKKPRAPWGLLSLRHYTDICALAEFIVCWTILPLLMSNDDCCILLPIQDRIRHTLPKTIAGRLPTAALVWAATTASSSSTVRPNGTNNVPQQHNQPQQQRQLLWCTVGRLLLLDRFRPILLPRHLTDLYAAMLWTRHHDRHDNNNGTTTTTTTDDNNNEPDEEKQIMLTTTMRDDLADRYGVWGVSRNGVVDAIAQARTYQQLLQFGTRAPAWLRNDVSTLLGGLARRNLAAIVAVFVVAADDDTDGTAAAGRLARALVTSLYPNESDDDDDNDQRIMNDQQRDGLVSQMLHCLDTIQRTTNANDTTTKQTQYLVQTIWAVADGLPDDRFIQAMWNDDDDNIPLQDLTVPPSSQITSILVLLHRLQCLWIFPPPPLSTVPMRLLLTTRTTTNRANHNNNEDRFVATPCLSPLQLLVRIMAVESAVLHSSAKAQSQQILRAVLLDTAAATATAPADVDALAVALLEAVTPHAFDAHYMIRLTGDSVVVVEQQEKETPEEDGNNDLMAIGNGIERRCTALCDILSTAAVSSPHKKDHHRPPAPPLLPFLFRTLLTSYLSDRTTSFAVLSNFDLVPMVLLPLLCEKFTVNQLVDENGSILVLLQIVLANVLRRTGSDHQHEHPAVDTRLQQTTSISETEKQRFLAATRRFYKLSGRPLATTSTSSTIFGHVDTSVDSEMLLGITSILLAMLISILELGCSVHCANGNTLDSLADLLSLVAQGRAAATAASDDSQLGTSELTEMASQAVVLIHAQKAGVTNQSNGPSTVQEKLEEAKQGLVSTDPPLRARGMAILRNLAHGTNATNVLSQILQLSIQALADDESYVFLAAIHTIVVVVEIRPTMMIPMLGFAQFSGHFEGHKLSNEQRVKLGEALVHVIRKRIGLLEELPRLLRLMLVGATDDGHGETLSASQRLEAHNATHEYFIKDVDDNETDDANWQQEREIRCRTGGPLFVGEESAVVVAERLHIVSELIAVVAPSVTANYCKSLVDSAIAALTLDKERPLRRAGASLTYEIFRAIVDRDEHLDLAVALASSRFDVLEATLQRIVSNREMEERLHDPATMTRCQDALRMLEECQIQLAAGRLALEEQQKMDNHPVGRLLSTVEKVYPRLELEKLL
jgi:Required for nuclear transport of RNA pol II C-terminus 1